MQYIILHGTGCSPQDHRFPWVRDILEAKWHTVYVPALPHAEKPNRQERSSYIFGNYSLNEETVLIWHSSWATVILSILEKITKPIQQAILVSWFFVELPEAKRAKLMLQEAYNREKIQQNAAEIILINSDNDPRGCTALQAQPIAEKLWATCIVAPWMGHMWSWTFNDPCENLPILLNYL